MGPSERVASRQTGKIEKEKEREREKKKMGKHRAKKGVEIKVDGVTENANVACAFILKSRWNKSAMRTCLKNEGKERSQRVPSRSIPATESFFLNRKPELIGIPRAWTTVRNTSTIETIPIVSCYVENTEESKSRNVFVGNTKSVKTR